MSNKLSRVQASASDCGRGGPPVEVRVMSVVQTAQLSLSKCFFSRLVLMSETIVRRWRHRTIKAVFLKWRELMSMRKRLGFVATLVTCLLQNVQATITVRLMEYMFMTWCGSTLKQEHEPVFVQGLTALSTWLPTHGAAGGISWQVRQRTGVKKRLWDVHWNAGTSILFSS